MSDYFYSLEMAVRTSNEFCWLETEEAYRVVDNLSALANEENQ